MAFFQSFGKQPRVTDKLKDILTVFATKLASPFSNAFIRVPQICLNQAYLADRRH